MRLVTGLAARLRFDFGTKSADNAMPTAAKHSAQSRANSSHIDLLAEPRMPSCSISACLTWTVSRSATGSGPGAGFPSWCGADDHMTKPFGMREPNARLGGALRHGQAAEGADGAAATLEVGPDSLDITRYQATYGGQPLELTPKEFEFLAYLARSAGKVCTRRMILENV